MHHHDHGHDHSHDHAHESHDHAHTHELPSDEKKRVALVSVFAAVFLTVMKILIGLLTGSLGILSEALHSCLDLLASVITYLSVRVSALPANKEFNYGHGKIENLSALAETLLLLFTSVWIIYEAAVRLITGKLEIEVNLWSYVVIVASILIDYNRSHHLGEAAHKHHSQALEADALHFFMDIWSSGVVLLGLILSHFGWFAADAIAALMVALIVIRVSYRLGKRAVDEILDRSPENIVRQVSEIVSEMPEIIFFHDVKARTSGANILIELCIDVASSITIDEAHRIADEVEHRVQSLIPRSTVHVHQEPEHEI